MILFGRLIATACLFLLVTNSLYAKQYVVGISPFLPEQSRQTAFSDLLKFLLSDIDVGDQVTIYNAYHLRQIGEFNIPDNTAYQSAKARAKLNKKTIVALKRFMNTDTHTENGSISAIQFPQFISFVGSHGQNIADTSMVVIGSPLHIDEKESSYSMVEGFLPSDGHLNESVLNTPYGTTEKQGLLNQTQIHFLTQDATWTSDLHEELTHRFWSLFVNKLGGALISFSHDPDTIYNRAKAKKTNVARSFELDSSDTKLEMVSVQRAVSQRTIETVFESPPEITAPLTTNYQGQVLVGIRWTCLKCDIDLYAQPNPTAQVLHYGLTRTAEGTYHKDFRSSPAPVNGLEYIAFSNEVDLRQLQVAINFFKGRFSNGPEVEVRIEFNGRVYARNYRIPAKRGNRGANYDGRERDPYWVTIDPVSLVFGGQ